MIVLMARLLPVVVLALIPLAPTIDACTCAPLLEGPEGVAAGLRDSEIVLTAYVVSKSVEMELRPTTQNDDSELKPKPWATPAADPRTFPTHYGVSLVRSLAHQFVLRVFHVWKGDPPETLEFRISVGRGMCGYDFRVGETYLIYGYPGGASICSRTAVLKHRVEDIAILGEPKIDYVRDTAEKTSSIEPQ